MSPIETQYFFARKIPISERQIAKSDEILYEKERNPFATKPYLTREIRIGHSGESVVFVHDVLDVPHDAAEGQQESIYHPVVTELRGAEINEQNPNNLPCRTNRPGVTVRLRWFPKDES